jgi:hypothetical protein
MFRSLSFLHAGGRDRCAQPLMRALSRGSLVDHWGADQSPPKSAQSNYHPYPNASYNLRRASSTSLRPPAHLPECEGLPVMVEWGRMVLVSASGCRRVRLVKPRGCRYGDRRHLSIPAEISA